MGKTRKQEGAWGKKRPYKRDKKHKTQQTVSLDKERASEKEEGFWESLYQDEGEDDFEKFSNRGRR